MSDVQNNIKLVEFRRLIDNELKDFLQSADTLGGLLQLMGVKVKNAFEAQYRFITTGIQITQPDDARMQSMLKPLGDIIGDIQEFRDQNRHENVFNHLSAVSESIMALCWVTRNAAPAGFVHEMNDAGCYYGNRVLSANKNNPPHLQFIRNWGRVLTALEMYVHEHHKTGFAWNVSNLLVYAGAGGRIGAGGDLPLPPPPPPPPEQPEAGGAVGAGDAGGAVGQPDRSALLQDINRGESITELLKPSRARSKFTLPSSREDSFSQWRSPEVRIGEPISHFTPLNRQVPKFQLDGRKWVIEYQQSNYSLVVTPDDMAQTISMHQCTDVTLEVRGKVNGISIGHTRTATIAIQDIIASVELIRCANISLHIGRVPTINLDRCESVQIFLSETSGGVELITSNCTSLNVCISQADGTYVEFGDADFRQKQLILNTDMVYDF